MDYSSMNHGIWAGYLPVFKNVLRPSAAGSSVADMGPHQHLDDEITAARAASSHFGALGDGIVTVVFGGYSNWYSCDDEWILRNLSGVLDDAGVQELQILNQIYEIVGTESAEALDSALGGLLADVKSYLAVWRPEAADEGYATADTVDAEKGGAAILEGTPNDANWEACRTPGTRYYIYYEGRYLYSDLPRGSLRDWEELQSRQAAAESAARPWRDLAGAAYTPTNNPELYGDHYVYRVASDGAWLTMAQAEAGAASLRTEPEEIGPREIVEPYGQGVMKAVNGRWLYAADETAATWYADYQEMLRAEGLDEGATGDPLGSISVGQRVEELERTWRQALEASRGAAVQLEQTQNELVRIAEELIALLPPPLPPAGVEELATSDSRLFIDAVATDTLSEDEAAALLDEHLEIRQMVDLDAADVLGDFDEATLEKIAELLAQLPEGTSVADVLGDAVANVFSRAA